MKKTLALLLSAVSLFGATFGAACSNGNSDEKSDKVTVNFDRKIGTEVQNLKKIDQFSPTWEFCGTGEGMVNYESVEQLGYIDDLQSERFRIDLMMGNGGIGSLIGNNSDGTTDKEFNAVVEIANKLYENNLAPMFVMCNIPEYAQLNGNSKGYPDELRYYEIVYNIVSYLKNRNFKNMHYETWNEPDLGTVFWGGSMEEIIDTSIIQTKAIRAADEYATVSALGLCWPLDFISGNATSQKDGVMTHWKRFWTRSMAEGAMPDSLSWHYYGQPGGMMEGNTDITTDWSYWLSVIREAFNTTQNGTNPEFQGEKVDLSTMQQHVTEYHPASSLDSLELTTSNVSKMYDSIGYALDATDLTRVYWACYVSELFGVIDKYSYQKNAGFNVLWSYARLPLDRVSYECNNKNVGVYAGADSSRAGAIVYNKSEEKQVVSLTMDGIPFDAEDLTVYLIDAEHLQTSTDIVAPHIAMKKTDLKAADLKNLTLTLEGNTGYYIEINDESGKSEIETLRSIGDILKKEYYYYERGNKKPYAELHNNSLTAIVGMGNNVEGRSAVSAIIDTDNAVDSFVMSYEGWGTFLPSSSSSLGFKIDFQTSEGYTKSVYYALSGHEADLILPFGAKSEANEIVVMDGSGKQTVNLKAMAPSGWNGIIQITYLIKDAGYGATEKFTINL